ncbi:MAG: RNA polymerase sigma factor [Planctomycetaceae bacterium]
MNPRRETDERLMQQTARGERAALTVLLRRHANCVLTFLRRMTGDLHRSEELFQDVFLAVWTGRRRYSYPRPFRSWLFGIAANKCRANFRKRSEPALPIGDAAVPVGVRPGPSPPEQAVATETAVMVEQAVMRLPAAQRSVVVMRIWNDLSYDEIAEVLNLAAATVRSHMSLGLSSLRKLLEPRMRESSL